MRSFITALLLAISPAAFAEVIVFNHPAGFTFTLDTEKACPAELIELVAPPFRGVARSGSVALPDGSSRKLCFAFIGDTFAFVDEQGEGTEFPAALVRGK